MFYVYKGVRPMAGPCDGPGRRPHCLQAVVTGRTHRKITIQDLSSGREALSFFCEARKRPKEDGNHHTVCGIRGFGRPRSGADSSRGDDSARGEPGAVEFVWATTL